MIVIIPTFKSREIETNWKMSNVTQNWISIFPVCERCPQSYSLGKLFAAISYYSCSFIASKIQGILLQNWNRLWSFDTATSQIYIILMIVPIIEVKKPIVVANIRCSRVATDFLPYQKNDLQNNLCFVSDFIDKGVPPDQKVYVTEPICTWPRFVISHHDRIRTLNYLLKIFRSKNSIFEVKYCYFTQF